MAERSEEVVEFLFLKFERKKNKFIDLSVWGLVWECLGDIYRVGLLLFVLLKKLIMLFFLLLI